MLANLCSTSVQVYFGSAAQFNGLN